MSNPDMWEALERGTEDGIEWLTAQAPLYGAVNGYVKVPESHPWYGKGYDEINNLMDYDCPGGLTYSEGGWIGFDTLHLMDYWPGMDFRPYPGATHWTPEQVAEEARKLARKVAEAGSNREAHP